MIRRLVLLLALLLVAGVVAWRVTADDPEPAEGATTPTTSSALAAPVWREPPAPPRAPDDLAAAESEPVEDSVYPRVGDPGIDVLHYGLGLDWQPGERLLSGRVAVTFRVPEDADRVVLDLSPALQVDAVRLDGQEVAAEHRGKDLLVPGDLAAGTTYVAEVDYHGTPEPVPAPTVRRDFTTTGWTTEKGGVVWTMQEPYGAYTWYPVHDHPSDKAFYSVAISVPAPWVGVTNGALVSREESGGRTLTAYRLDAPAASYLTTIALGPYRFRSATGPRGVPITTWAMPRHRDELAALDSIGPLMEWIEERLGPYPFDTIGGVVTDSDSAMETQTMMTFGDNEYVLSEPVVLHELVHQWYGDTVTPADWSDVWLNEGMTMFVQLAYQAGVDGVSVATEVTRYVGPGGDQRLRDEAGPPGAYAAGSFGSSNIYSVPALMWLQLYRELGAEEFWRIASAWVVEQRDRSVTRDDLYAFWERETDRELSAFFDAWIEGTTTPPSGVPDRGRPR